MNLTDLRDFPLTGASGASLAHYETALRQFNLFAGDPLATIDSAIAQSPNFVMGHVLKAYLLLLGAEPIGRQVGRQALASVKNLSVSAQERGHLQALEHLVEGRLRSASRVLEDITIDHPRDLLALQTGHQVDFLLGDARMLRDRIARALPHWSESNTAFHTVLGMYAFGLEETGRYSEAETMGRRAIELEPRDCWAQHAVAHVLEMQGRHREGIAWMEGSAEQWSKDSFLAAHNWWHLALYYLDLGDIEKVLELYDTAIYGAKSQVIFDLIDASAMLWRLHLRRIDVGHRWSVLADVWDSISVGGQYAFGDIHAAMAFVGAGRKSSIGKLRDAQQSAMRDKSDNAIFLRDIGRPLVDAMVEFGGANYHISARLLREVRGIAHRFGGSHAQRDIIDLTLIEAAIRSDDSRLSTALTTERLASKPTSPLAHLFAQRASQIDHAA